jgi:hypothetical protein
LASRFGAVFLGATFGASRRSGKGEIGSPILIGLIANPILFTAA